MIKYIPATRAADLSAALFALSRPLSARIPGEVTNFLCAVKQDLKGGLWVVLDDQQQVKVHELADLTEIAPLVQPLITAGALATNTLELLQQKLDAGRGGWINVFDSLPDEIQVMALDEAQMIQENRLANPTLP